MNVLLVGHVEVHAVVPAFVQVAHLAQVPDPAFAFAVPAGQILGQVDALTKEYPAGEASQEVDPWLVVKEPEEQAVQVLEPADEA